MTKARDIISGTLRFSLNRLAPGETLDPDLGSVCLEALNHIADRLNGSKAFLFREVLTPSLTGITGASASLSTNWSLSPGDEIIGATVSYSSGMDVPMDEITMAQYAVISIKSTASIPRNWAHDGQDTVYLYPAAAGQTITLRTKQTVSDFADLDTDYIMPKGYKSGLSAMLAEALAPSILGSIPPAVTLAVRAARAGMGGQTADPAIIAGRNVQGNILAGWR
jgi:hypothetical protein